MDAKCDKCPKTSAYYLSKIRGHNYLAHTIRDIEYEIHQKKLLSYHITITLRVMANDSSKVFFYKKGCTIFLPKDCTDMGNKDIRAILAHELGHIWYNMDEIDVMKPGFHSPDEVEEDYAWKFAYCLLKNKSNDYKDGIGIDEYKYYGDELQQLLIRMVNRQQPNLYGKIKDFLKNQDTH